MSFLSGIGKLVFLLYRKAQIERHELDYLFWECTLRCNLNCLHCGSDCLKCSGIDDMPIEDFTEQLRLIKKEWPQKKLTVCITGGEPLLRVDLENAGREIVRLGYRWGIVTNAMLMTKERFSSLMDAGMSSISFSLDGFKNEHNHLRNNPQCYQRVMQAIETALEIQRDKKRSLVFDVITCVHKGNIKILREFRESLIENGITDWRIFSIFPEGRAGLNDLSLTSREYVELMEFIKETRQYRTEDGKSIHLNYSCEGYLEKYELKVRDYFFFCRAGVNVGSIMCDGNASGCLSVRSKAFIQGNIYETSFPEIWKTRYRNMRDRSWAKCGKCAKCKSFKRCLGNGLHLHRDDCSEPARCNMALIRNEMASK